jgi:MFS transporter, PPP family, 3-phenylpropionic acid transporter
LDNRILLQKPPPSDGFALRLAIFYVAVFFIVGCYLPFLPLWLKWRGLTDFQISLAYAAPIFLRALFIPVMTFAADRSGRPAQMLLFLSWGTLFSVALLPLAEGFPAIFAVIILYTLFWMSVVPLTESVTLAGARIGRGDYGRIRVWGSLSFVAMTLAGGAAIDLWGPGATIWLFIGSAAWVLVSVHLLPKDSAGPALHEAETKPKVRIADLLRLIRKPDLWLFLLATSAIQSAHAVYYVFGSVHWTSSGISPTAIGALWAIGVIAEIVLFIYARSLGRWFGPVQLIALGGVAAILRWSVIAANPPLPVLFLAQMLHGLTFGAAHMGAMQFMTAAVPPHMATSAQGLYASITAGIAMGLASLAAGPLYRTYAGDAYFAMALLGGTGLIFALLLIRRWRGGVIVGAADF